MEDVEWSDFMFHEKWLSCDSCESDFAQTLRWSTIVGSAKTPEALRGFADAAEKY
jgi:hypothetical protein